MKSLNNVLFIICTCCREESRFNVLRKVIENFHYNFIDEYNIQDNLIVFDNASNDETVDLLDKNFKNVYRSDNNLGYWTALYWCLKNAEIILNKKLEFCHIMESDHSYKDLYKLNWCVELLEATDQIGSIKLHEYYPHLAYLYNKVAELPNSRKHDWISHHNKFKKRSVSLSKIEGFHDHFYLSDFITQLHNLTRFDYMIDIFEQLKTMKQFTEGDFHRLYFNKNPYVAVLNGGIFNMKLGYSDVVAGSAQGWTPEVEKELKKHGYVQTNVDHIHEDDSYNVYKIE